MEIVKQSVEKIGEILKKAAWVAVLESLLTMILGVFLVVWPELVVQTIAYVVGGFLVVRGGYKIVNYFIMQGQNDFFNNNLLWGVITVLSGVTVLVMGEGIANLFRIVIGIWMIYEALSRMNTAMKLSGTGIRAGRYVLVLALMMLVLGTFIVFNEGAVTVLVGWMMVAIGLFGVVGDVIFMQYLGSIIEKLGGIEK